MLRLRGTSTYVQGFRKGQRLGRVATFCRSKERGAVQRLEARRRRRVVRGQRALEPFAALTCVASHQPEAGKRAGETLQRLGVALGLEPVQRRTQVVVLALQTIDPLALVCRKVRLGRLGQREEIRGVTAADLFSDLFRRELADRLEHPVAIAGATE